MNTRWNAGNVYESHREERKSRPPNEFTTLDRSHLASRISLAAFDSSFATVLLGTGRIAATDHLQVGKGFRPALLRGVKKLGTEAAHRSSGSIWVSLARSQGDTRFNKVASRVPARFTQSEGMISAPLHLFAGSKNGAAMLLGSERATTLLPRWENLLNSFMESHGERQARNDLLRNAQQLHSTSSSDIASYTLEQLYGQFVPALTKAATEMLSYYDHRARTTRHECDNFLAEKAEEYRDVLAQFGRNHDMPPLNLAEAVVPAATFIPLERGTSALIGFERSGEVIEGWTEQRVGTVNLLVPNDGRQSSANDTEVKRSE